MTWGLSGQILRPVVSGLLEIGHLLEIRNQGARRKFLRSMQRLVRMSETRFPRLTTSFVFQASNTQILSMLVKDSPNDEAEPALSRTKVGTMDHTFSWHCTNKRRVIERYIAMQKSIKSVRFQRLLWRLLWTICSRKRNDNARPSYLRQTIGSQCNE